MIWMVQLWLYRSCLTLYLVGTVLSELGNPYQILGVHRKASQQEIRQAYKQLVKEWHPDKSKELDAESRFVEIKQAYELLSDSDRRRLYDQQGITDEDAHKKPERSTFFTSSPLDDLFSHHGGYFNFQENDIVFFHKLSITTRQYDKIVVPKSEKTPHLIYFYSDFCFPCLQTAPYCRKLLEYLEPLGINFVTVHSGREPNLNRRLSIHALPCLVLLLDGNVYVYKETLTSVPKIVAFIKSKLPYKLVPRINKGDLDTFLDGWKDNRVRGLIFEPRPNLRLRYLIAAYHFRHRVAFAFVDSDEIRLKYGVPRDMDTVMLFNENTSTPVAKVTLPDIPMIRLHDVIVSNQYLALPRLSSQRVLEALCPCEWHKPRKRLCVVLVTEDTPNHDPHRDSFRQFAQKAPYNADKVRFAYIYHGKQSTFIASLVAGYKSTRVEPTLRVVIFWRRDTSHLMYEWFGAQWDVADSPPPNRTSLLDTISRLVKTSEAFTYEAYVTDLLDEHATGAIARLIRRVSHFVESIYDSLDKDQILPALSIVGTMLFILAVGYLMAYLVAKEEEQIRREKERAKSGNNNNDDEGHGGGAATITSYQPELKLHELRSEKYNALVRLLKPGCRTLLLIVDAESRRQLIPPYHKAAWPYRRNKTLMFAYMCIERGLAWYAELLQLSLGEERELKINPRNCVGTVLALNGHRKYFCVFHAKHTESGSRRRRSKAAKKGEDCESGAAFIGFDSASSGSESEEVLLQGSLLDGLPNWLDRLFEGSTQRYHINYWPEFPIK
ncbi:dnaJ homolog subfamily C member 16 [Cylas formicarius]|uniref:dnaJ homolog subfamily C member 16 n=1 Tax=Cylas formicarius TaxID=197179 RepID=UPI00295852FC|nr:dnaJ homolog subfamily C member 16 [Cylas formicarius]XP_060523695.1 dnaJ homolog subfamily C member 16 [Cylas formicarius]XP_060523777.1 dnaJ homolog subfamily C member 16 [Cylas formicarius]